MARIYTLLGFAMALTFGGIPTGCTVSSGMGQEDTESEPETESSTESVTDSDADSDADTDSYTDADTDTDVDVDTDSDVDTESDECPDDIDKRAPGICGCGVSDVDEDGDGAMDCEDACPSNPAIQMPGTITFRVEFAPDAGLSELHKGIADCMVAAGEEWAKYLAPLADVEIDVLVNIDDIPTANGRSATTVFSRHDDASNLDVYQAGVSYEILTGIDPNDDSPDAEINWGIDALTGDAGWKYFFEEDPWLRTESIPPTALDGQSTCLHELGHALGFTGWRDSDTGELIDDYATEYDLLSIADGDDFFFNGALAKESYGAPVPETYQNIRHIANVAPRPGTDLQDDLMRGTYTDYQKRYYISPLDLAILADTNLPVIGSDVAASICDASPGTKSAIRPSRSELAMTGPALPFTE